MSQIEVKNLTFSYEGSYENIFDNVSFSFDTNWKIGFIGRNGRGKTTFLNLLLNKLKYEGQINHSVNFEYFPCDIQNKDNLTIDVLSEIYPDYELWKVLKLTSELKLKDECFYEKFSSLSNGEQTKFLLAILFTKEDVFLLIDEPTNHLDYETRECIKDFLGKRKGFIVVSHDRDFLDSCVDHIISINKNNIDIQKGNFSSWWQNKQNEDNFELKKNEDLRKSIEKLKESSRRIKTWGDKVEKTKNGTRVGGLKVDKGAVGHKAVKMMKRSKAIETRRNKEISEKEKLLKNIDYQEDLFVTNSQKIKSDKSLIELKDVSIFYSDKKVVNNFSLSLSSGDRVALIGENGSGKSSILRLIIGKNINFTGNLYKDSKLKFSFISQNFENLNGCIDDFIVENNLNRTEFYTLLIKLGLNRNQFSKNISNLSLGQKKKLLIAKSLCEKSNIYIWDEPLNYIDVISRIQIENLIKENNLTMIIVEHDIAFIKSVANKIYKL